VIQTTSKKNGLNNWKDFGLKITVLPEIIAHPIKLSSPAELIPHLIHQLF
jgi:hypothetical protein